MRLSILILKVQLNIYISIMDISFPDPGKVNSTQLHLALASFFFGVGIREVGMSGVKRKGASHKRIRYVTILNI